MHYLRTFLPAALLALSFAGCQNHGHYASCDVKKTIESDPNTLAISDAAYGYLDAVSNFRFDDAEAFASDETKNISIKFFKQMTSLMVQDTIDAKLPAYVTINGVVVVDDTTAKVAYRKKDNRVDHTDTLNLVRRNGEWKADVMIVVPPFLQEALDTNRRMGNDSAAMHEAMKMRHKVAPR